VPGLDDLGHLPVEEGQQQRADVRAVDVGVGHDHDLVVAQLVERELVAQPVPIAWISVPTSLLPMIRSNRRARR
jgi:hypothetical protein